MPHHPLLDTPQLPPNPWLGGTFFILLVSSPNRGASVLPLILPTFPPVLPYCLTYIAPSLVSTYFYLISLTFSLGPDEAATVWWLQKLVCDLNAIYFVSAIKESTLIRRDQNFFFGSSSFPLHNMLSSYGERKRALPVCLGL